MRSRQSNAATARAFRLVITPDFDPLESARALAETTSSIALEEAVAHLHESLFADEDRVATDAAEVLLLALRWRRSAAAA